MTKILCPRWVSTIAFIESLRIFLSLLNILCRFACGPLDRSCNEMPHVILGMYTFYVFLNRKMCNFNFIDSSPCNFLWNPDVRKAISTSIWPFCSFSNYSLLSLADNADVLIDPT